MPAQPTKFAHKCEPKPESCEKVVKKVNCDVEIKKKCTTKYRVTHWKKECKMVPTWRWVPHYTYHEKCNEWKEKCPANCHSEKCDSSSSESKKSCTSSSSSSSSSSCGCNKK